MTIIPHPRLFPDQNPSQPFPLGFVTNRMSEASLAKDCAGYPYLTLAGTKEIPGLRYAFGPVCWEEFETETEPPLLTAGPKRLVFWHPFSFEAKPSLLWKPLPFFMPQPIIKQWGYAKLENRESYSKNWSEHARRHRKKWLAQDAWDIEEISLDAFLEAYRHSPKDFLLIAMFSNLLKNKIRTHGPLLHLFGARKKNTGKIRAGLAVLDTPEIKSSLHFISFIYPDAQKESVGVGLIDRWFQHGFTNRLRFLDFGAFWAPGSTKDWIGFSNFKAQFSTILYTRPPSVYAWAGSLKETIRQKQKNIP